MKLRQQTPHCADFDVFPDGEDAPLFRVLLPELITADGLGQQDCPLFHTIPGRWEVQSDGVEGTFVTPHSLAVSVSVRFQLSEIAVALTVRNETPQTLTSVEGNICVSPNHLPGAPGWYNPRFIPEMAPDRDAQGRRWYAELSPGRLQALTGAGWVEMHAHPDNPDPDTMPHYSFAPSPRADTVACAAPSLDGTSFLFQAWSCPCRFIAPFPGNACMHLLPKMADALPPGAKATIHGLVGIHDGDRGALEAHIRQFRGHVS